MSSHHLLQLTDASFNQTVASSPILLVDFWAPWCGPCKMIGPVIDEIAEELAGKVTVAKVNVDDCPAIAAEHRISAIPTIMIFRDGQLVDRSTGLASKAGLLEKLK
ncbi:MAG: thioredoxin [Verrucomicrobia bacterium]|jgi:thioredoxin 1|nr:MAG: thioredoxin [Verrucomicrobiota bacterium]MDH4470185.1 thioredoxin [Verrucomicrobiae bacterium]